MREKGKKKSHPNNFHPVGAKMQITDQRRLEWKLARLGRNIIKPGLYMYVQVVRETCWTQVMELTCTWTLPPTATIIFLLAFSQGWSVYSTVESNSVSPYATLSPPPPLCLLQSMFRKSFSRASNCLVYTDLHKCWGLATANGCLRVALYIKTLFPPLSEQLLLSKERNVKRLSGNGNNNNRRRNVYLANAAL